MSDAALDIPDRKMTSEEFFKWAEDKPGRYELHRGRIYPKSVEGHETVLQAERGRHTLAKFNVAKALDQAARSSTGDCRAFVDGLTVQCAHGENYIPDALVNCGPIDLNELHAPNPVIVVEVVSPGSKRLDAVSKLEAYLTNEHVQNYLIVDPDSRRVVHYKRTGDYWQTRIIGDGKIRFAPPGLVIETASFFEDFPPEEAST